jgi:membrane protein involved in colicin uptake
MEYWNALPFQGWHRPDWLRISDNRYRDPDPRYESSAEEAHEKAIEKAERLAIQKKATEERNERKRIEQAKKTAEERAKIKAMKEAYSKREQEAYADKQARWAQMQKSRKEANEARAVAKMLGLPPPPLKYPPRDYTPAQIEARRQRAREYNKTRRKTDPSKRTEGKPVKVTKADGRVIVYPSAYAYCKAENHSRPRLRQSLATGKPHTYDNGDTVEYERA